MYEINILQTDWPILAWSGFFITLFTIIVILASLWSWIWAWVDDAEETDRNIVLKGISKLIYGRMSQYDKLAQILSKCYSDRSTAEDSLARSITGKRSNSLRECDLSEYGHLKEVPYYSTSDYVPVETYFMTLFLIVLSVISVLYIQYSIWIISTVAILHLARGGRRLQKKVNAHISDPNTHSGKDDKGKDKD